MNIRLTEAVVRYYGSGDELHLSFDFPPIDVPWDAAAFRRVMDDVETQFHHEHTWPTWTLSNHDNERHRTCDGGSVAWSRAVAVPSLTMRGTPFLFQGEELGLEDAVVALDQRVIGGRMAWAPIPWTAVEAHGWEGKAPWMPFPPDADRRNAATLRADASSILHLYRELLCVRRGSPALTAGTLQMLPASSELLAYRRRLRDDERVVIVNFSDQTETIEIDGAWTIELTSGDDVGGNDFGGTVPAERALVLRPAETDRRRAEDRRRHGTTR